VNAPEYRAFIMKSSFIEYGKFLKHKCVPNNINENINILILNIIIIYFEG
jgi:hypothetical protein